VTAARESVLCVDLDGSLVATDLLAESILLLLKMNPLYLLMLPVWLARGRCHLKHEVARRVRLNAAVLPYHAEVLTWLRDEHRSGRRIILATASDHALASCVADHLGLFAAVHASDGHTNLKGAAKSALLVDRYGSRGFAYVGNSRADISIWRQADSAIIVGGDDALAAQVAAETPVVRRFAGISGFSARAQLRAMRPHQWVKNFLIFVPLVTAHQVTNMIAVSAAVCAFAAMCLASAAIYIVNDLLDLEADRAHATKHARAFASGQLPILSGVVLAPALVLAAFAIASGLPRQFAAWLAAYVLVTIVYSLRLKHVAVVDVLVLALLYTVRLVAGAAAIAVPFSAWLLAFSLFFFFSLALLKRFSELDVAVRKGFGPDLVRGYRPADRNVVGQFGVTSGYLSILVMALYTNSRDVAALYSNPAWLWGFCPLLLYWISRIWLAAYRGDMHEDPIIFAVRQVSSYLIVAGLGVFMYLAI
jgi:4-hydroxybenzoate polyprenyltransferase/phosphoserine phosphatase